MNSRYNDNACEHIFVLHPDRCRPHQHSPSGVKWKDASTGALNFRDHTRLLEGVVDKEGGLIMI